MDIRTGFIGSIGNTPLIRLEGPSKATGCEILGKAEFLNPGGSVKDRAALAIVRDAERRGLLRPGGTIVEGTAGNTGIGLALVGNALGYRTVIVMPETQSQEKKDMLRLIGADLRLVPAVPYSNPDNYVRYSGRLAEELAKTEPNGAVWANQFDNVANREGHRLTTGPEIWFQTEGRIDAFTCAVGSGGTLAGVGLALKERDPNVRIVLADPMGASLYNFYAHGALKAEGSSITEGIGQGRITANLEGAPVDQAIQVTDEEALPVIFDLIKTQGLVLGGSSGINVAAAIRIAREMGPGHTIVTILCDGGQRYQSKLFNPAFLREKNLPVPDWLDTYPPRGLMDLIFREDAYAKSCSAVVTSVDERGIRLDRTVFYPNGGGQPGDTGVLRHTGGEVRIVDTVKGDGIDDVVHVPEPGAALPAPGTPVEAEIDWDRRHRHMRMHTALHLVCAVLPGASITGAQVGAERSRVDFNLPAEALDKEGIAAALNALIAADTPVGFLWITDEELDANPDLIRTLTVKPPRGYGRVRLVDIAGVDRQPCGGTHVARLGEIGMLEVLKIENKGKQNRRVVVALKD